MFVQFSDAIGDVSRHLEMLENTSALEDVVCNRGESTFWYVDASRRDLTSSGVALRLETPKMIWGMTLSNALERSKMIAAPGFWSRAHHYRKDLEVCAVRGAPRSRVQPNCVSGR